MNASFQSYVSSRAWFWWLWANVIGVAGVFAFSMAAYFVIQALFGGESGDQVPFVELVGLGIGLMQWLVIRRWLPHAWRWIPATWFGWLVGIGLYTLVLRLVELAGGDSSDYTLFALVFAAAVGTVMGVVQWLVLRGSFTGAGWWVLANAAGWLLAMLAIGKSIDRAIDLLSLAFLPPLVPAFVLVWLLQRPRREQNAPTPP